MGNHHNTEQKLLNDKQRIWNILNESNVYKEAIQFHKPWIKMKSVPIVENSKPFQITDSKFMIFNRCQINIIYLYNSITKQWNQNNLQNNEIKIGYNYKYTYNHLTNTLYFLEYSPYQIYEINLNNNQYIKHKMSDHDHWLNIFANNWGTNKCLFFCADNELHLIDKHHHLLWNIKHSKSMKFKHINCAPFYTHNEKYSDCLMKCIHVQSEHKLILIFMACCRNCENKMFEYSIYERTWKKLDIVLPKINKYDSFDLVSCNNDRFILIVEKTKSIHIFDIKNKSLTQSSLQLIGYAPYKYVITDHSLIMINAFFNSVDIQYIPQDIINQIHCFVGCIEYLHAINMSKHWRVSVDEIIQ
eukprot:452586_1